MSENLTANQISGVKFLAYLVAGGEDRKEVVKLASDSLALSQIEVARLRFSLPIFTLLMCSHLLSHYFDAQPLLCQRMHTALFEITFDSSSDDVSVPVSEIIVSEFEITRLPAVLRETFGKAFGPQVGYWTLQQACTSIRGEIMFNDLSKAGCTRFVDLPETAFYEMGKSLLSQIVAVAEKHNNFAYRESTARSLVAASYKHLTRHWSGYILGRLTS